MLKKIWIPAVVLTFLLTLVTFISAQEKPGEKKDNQIMMQDEDMQKCMEKIATDEHMRGMMMQKMMDHTKSDSSGMMQMCRMMMDNPEMHRMMMKMMHDEGMMEGKMMNHDMMKDSTKNKSDYESHH